MSIKEEDGRFYVYNTAGTKKLTPLHGYATREEAKKREQAIEGFMHGDDAKQEKFAKVMREFEAGTLKSSSGELATSRKQAQAIAASEAGLNND